MQERAAKGEHAVRPDYITYSTVISAWAFHGHDKRATEVLRAMYDDYLTGNVTAKPDLQCFNSALAAFTRSQQKDAPIRAIAFFEQMQALAEERSLNIYPDVYSYTSGELYMRLRVCCASFSIIYI